MNYTDIEDRKRDDSKFTYQFIFKIILIGDSGTGKTSIMQRFVTSQFSDKYSCTIGVDFMTKSIQIEKETIKLQIWDTAGMEKFRQITTSYYRGAQAVIICFDLSNRITYNSLSKWINDFCTNHNPVLEKIVIIVGNKADLIDERAVSIEEIENFVKENKYIYFETSAKTGDNIDILFDSVGKTLHSNYKTDKNSQIKNSVQIKRTNLSEVDNFQNLLQNNKKNNKCSC